MNDLSKEKRICEEFERISSFFEELRECEKAVVFPLIQNSAFMRVTLDDLQEIIAEQGCVEAYQNGEHQHGLKQSAALQSYNALIKNYTAVVKKLFDLLPPEKRPSSYELWKQEQVEEREKTQEEIEAERKAELEKQVRLKTECERANAFQAWQREQEKKGIKTFISFAQWKEMTYGEEVENEG